MKKNQELRPIIKQIISEVLSELGSHSEWESKRLDERININLQHLDVSQKKQVLNFILGILKKI